MENAERREAIRRFVNRWTEKKGKENQDDRSFWLELLQEAFGVEQATHLMVFQKQVIVDGHTKFIDAYLPDTRVLIEQKSYGIPLDKKLGSSDGSSLTPYEQAKRYKDNLPIDEAPRWIITCNFAEIWVYNMNDPVPSPMKLRLEELTDKISYLSFLLKAEVKQITPELEISLQAGEMVGAIYDALLEQYPDRKNPECLKSLNKLCVRLVFCLYAEDSGILGEGSPFHDYLTRFTPQQARKALVELFKVMNTPEDQRDPFLADDDPILASFPYVNGGLFADEEILIPPLTEHILTLILRRADEEFNWSKISPTIFGAVFESTLNPETRRGGGMHYTSIENIHKCIDPLFLDGLKEELRDIKGKSVKEKKKGLKAFQEKLAGLKFLDPACGSGNFLTETYLCLRRLENEVILELFDRQIQFGTQYNPIRVSIEQFYGIEINDFAVSVAQTALWIAESQMMRETEDVIHYDLNFLPLKSRANIAEGNALRLDWERVVPPSELSYIMGNPPFVGNARLSNEQKAEREKLFKDRGGELDYVCCWYKKAADYIGNKNIDCVFVSTNSISQGQQVAPLWKPLFESGIHIDFAHPTFRWDSEANIKAHVHCVIVGFSRTGEKTPRLFLNGAYTEVPHINAYLTPSEDVFIERRSKPLCSGAPLVIKGFQPTDNGYFIFDAVEKENFLKQEPNAEKFIRPFITAREYINQENRYCLWLVNASPSEINALPKVRERVALCKEWREKQVITGDAYKLRNTPWLMRKNTQFIEDDFIVLPRVTGEKRRYIPFAFITKGAIPGDSIMLAMGATLYHFGVLTSNVHMAWTRAVCGRLKSDYRYSKDIVYNNFPWPKVTEEQREKITETAQGILDARSAHPGESLADLYDPLLMPEDLRKAHQANDRAVMSAYGFNPKTTSEADCVAELMKMYQRLTA